ncbi:transposase [Paenibacillus sonchi]|nr:transposase [Paenibacillus sonchi]
MDAIRERCAGLDIHQETVVVCLLSGPLEKRPRSVTETFGTTTRELLRLQEWLEQQGCTEIAMESTGVFWKPVWNILESTCTITLANPHRIRNMPGKKTDVKDAEWIAKLHRCGLIEGSFVPDEPIRICVTLPGICANLSKTRRKKRTGFTKFYKMPTLN